MAYLAARIHIPFIYPVRTRSKLLYRAGSGMQDIFENPKIVPLEDQADDVYQ